MPILLQASHSIGAAPQALSGTEQLALLVLSTGAAGGAWYWSYKRRHSPVSRQVLAALSSGLLYVGLLLGLGSAFKLWRAHNSIQLPLLCLSLLALHLAGAGLFRSLAAHKGERFDFNALKFGLFCLGLAVFMLWVPRNATTAAAFALLGLMLLLDDALKLQLTSLVAFWQSLGLICLLAGAYLYILHQSGGLRYAGGSLLGLKVMSIPAEAFMMLLASQLLSAIALRKAGLQPAAPRPAPSSTGN